MILQETRKEFSKSKNHKVAVRNVSLGLNKGEIFALLGPNGAGKSTLISMITTELTPNAGLETNFLIIYNFEAISKEYSIRLNHYRW